jgi:tetratricopeptide (TPR) repeat protein
MNKFCRNCGEKLINNAEFCGQCGVKMNNLSKPIKDGFIKKEVTIEKDVKSKSKGRNINSIIGVLIFILIFGSRVIWTSYKEQQIYELSVPVDYNDVKELIVDKNPELYYNLGVSAMQMGNNEDAKTYYDKALELEPEYADAQINMAAVILQVDGALVEEMNNLGTPEISDGNLLFTFSSRADNLRYEALKDERLGIFQEALPYLEAASVTVPENVEVLRTLMDLYSQLGMNTQYKAAKAKIETMSDN